MNTKILLIGLVVFLVVVVIGLGVLTREDFPLPSGDSVPLDTTFEENTQEQVEGSDETTQSSVPATSTASREASMRDIQITDGTKHSIPLNDILSGGPGKDGIPSIDNPTFMSRSEADDFLEDANAGLGLTVDGESRFYPYRILVWHEIVNDTVQGEPLLVTYCPLCATGIVFDRRVDGEVQEFGVSGLLWQSNLLMYNRAATEEEESLWSQVLGEAVLGPNTGDRLPIVRSDVVRWGDWKKAHPDTKALSPETGISRNYGRDPYGDYYTDDSVSFGATFNDDRLHPKALVHGIEVNGEFKAYHDDAVKDAGTVNDTFAGKDIMVTANDAGEVWFTAKGEPLPSIPGFWFSWLAVHPETELYK